MNCQSLLVYGILIALVFCFSFSKASMFLGENIGSQNSDETTINEANTIKLPLKRHRMSNTKRIKLKNHRSVGYHVEIKVGSRGLKYNLLVDTGSSDLWLPSLSCNGCTQKNRFHCGLSTTCRTDFSGTVKGKYADGPVTGHVTYDQITLESVRVPSQSFLLINSASGHIANTEGILGLSFQAISMNYNPTLINNMRNLGLISRKMFSIYLVADEESDNNFLFLGGYDTNFARKGSRIHFFNLVTTMAYIIPLNSFEVGSLSIELPKAQALVDSGNSCVTLPRWTITTVKTILERDYGIHCEFYVETYAPSFSMMDCVIDKDSKEFPQMRPNINGVPHVLDPEDYIYECQELNESTEENMKIKCYTKLELSEDLSYTVLGMAFHHTFYVIYDLENRRVGIGKSTASNKIPLLDRSGKRLATTKTTKDSLEKLKNHYSTLREKAERDEMERAREREREREMERLRRESEQSSIQIPAAENQQNDSPESRGNQTESISRGSNNYVIPDTAEERVSRHVDDRDKSNISKKSSGHAILFIVIGCISFIIIIGFIIWIVRGNCSRKFPERETITSVEPTKVIEMNEASIENAQNQKLSLPTNPDNKLLDGTLFAKKKERNYSCACDEDSSQMGPEFNLEKSVQKDLDNRSSFLTNTPPKCDEVELGKAPIQQNKSSQAKRCLPLCGGSEFNKGKSDENNSLSKDSKTKEPGSKEKLERKKSDPKKKPQPEGKNKQKPSKTCLKRK